MTNEPIDAEHSTRSALRHLAFTLCVLTLSQGCNFAVGSSDVIAQPTSFVTEQPRQPSYADVVYAPTSPQQRLDLYLPAPQAALSPVVIWIHGGAFTVGDKRAILNNTLHNPPRAAIVPARGPLIVSQIQVPDVAALTAKGYAVVSLNYRLAPGLRSEKDFMLSLRQSVQDAKAAVRFLRANAAQYHLDPDKFAAWGNSAGGFIVSMLGATADQTTIFDDPSLGNVGVSSAVQAVVDWFGPIDFVSNDAQLAASRACAYVRTRPRLLPNHWAEMAMQYSPLTYIPRAVVLPSFLIAHGDADCSVPAAQSRELYTALEKSHGMATLTVLPGVGHEDPAFMQTQMVSTLDFIDVALGVTRTTPIAATPTLSNNNAPAQTNGDTARTTNEAWQFTAGLATINQPKLPGSSTRKTSVFPVFSATYDRFFAGAVPDTGIPLGLGIYLVQDQHWSIGTEVGETVFGNTGTTTLGAAFANYGTKYFLLTSNVKTDIEGHEQGTQFSINLLGQFQPIENLEISAGPGFTWANGEYMQKFFGIDAAQSAHLGLTPYTARGGIDSLRVTFGARYTITPNWDLGAELKAARLRGDAGNSPLTQSKSQDNFSIFAIYNF